MMAFDNNASVVVNVDDLSEEQRKLVQDAIDLFTQKSLMSFEKIQGKVIQKTPLPRVLMSSKACYKEERDVQQMLDEERYGREQTESHWNCPFFKHCWNEGLRLPTRDGCPECNNQPRKHLQSQPNRRFVHERLGQHMKDRRDEKCSIHERCAMDDDYYVRKKHVGLEERWQLRKGKAEEVNKARVWQTKQTAVSSRSADINTLCVLPKEYIGSEGQDVYSDQSEFEELAAQLSFVAQAIFNRPEHHRHLKALYVKGFIDGKPMGKVLIDGGASVNIMPYLMFRKLGKTSDDLIKTDL